MKVTRWKGFSGESGWVWGLWAGPISDGGRGLVNSLVRFIL